MGCSAPQGQHNVKLSRTASRSRSSANCEKPGRSRYFFGRHSCGFGNLTRSLQLLLWYWASLTCHSNTSVSPHSVPGTSYPSSFGVARSVAFMSGSKVRSLLPVGGVRRYIEKTTQGSSSVLCPRFLFEFLVCKIDLGRKIPRLPNEADTKHFEFEL